MAEVVQKHAFQDTYRIQYGTLLVVKKYRTHGHYSPKKGEFQNKRGVSKLRVLTKDVKDWWGHEWSAGTWMIYDTIIEPVSDPKDFRVELKMSGGTFEGSIEDYRRFQKDIEQILSTYSPAT